MARIALLIRGINVGRYNSLPMATLRSLLERLDCGDVQTYVQSGNAVFTASRPLAALTRDVEAALAKYMGRPIAVITRTATELRAVVAGNPFREHVDQPAKLCVTFLRHKPTPGELAPIRGQDFAPERFEIGGRHLYSWHPMGQSQGKLAPALARLSLRGATTTRNWNTVLKLQEMLDAE